MVAVDASVLACAVNRFVREHVRAARVVEELANGEAPWALPWSSVHRFMTFVTHPHAVARPLGAADAWGFVERLLDSGSVRALGPTERHGSVLAEVLAGLPPVPVDLEGLETATLLREHGVRELLTTDRGMRRFAFLTVRDPLHGGPWTPEAPPLRRYRTLRVRPRRG